MYEIFTDVPPTKILAPPLYTVYTVRVYLCCHLCPPKFLYVADPMIYSNTYYRLNDFLQ